MSARAGLGGIFVVLSMFVAAACGSSNSGPDQGPACLAAPVSTDCTPFYPPTFANVWNQTIVMKCALGGCHKGSDAKAGMDLSNKDNAYTELLTKSTTSEPRVTPGDLKCGKLIVRLDTKGEVYSMPPNNPLDEATLCSIRQWIANGAMNDQ
jgi:hypothetical protein